MGNVGIYTVGVKGVNQIVQSGRTKCLTGISREGLTREIFDSSYSSHVQGTCITSWDAKS